MDLRWANPETTDKCRGCAGRVCAFDCISRRICCSLEILWHVVDGAASSSLEWNTARCDLINVGFWNTQKYWAGISFFIELRAPADSAHFFHSQDSFGCALKERGSLASSSWSKHVPKLVLRICFLVLARPGIGGWMRLKYWPFVNPGPRTVLDPSPQ